MGCLVVSAKRVDKPLATSAADVTQRLRVSASVLCSVGQIGNGEAFMVGEGDFLVFEGKFLVKRIKAENYGLRKRTIGR